jgi:hypothetical protein
LIKHEEDLRQKSIEAERDMQVKQQAASELRRELMNSQRPRNVKNLVDLVTETDSGLSFHLQKFAILTETLVANQGNAVMPMGPGKLGTSSDITDTGFSALIGQISDGKDFRDYVLSFAGDVPKTNSYSGPSAPASYTNNGESTTMVFQF